MDFDKLSKRYARQSILLTAGLALLGLLVANVRQIDGIIVPLVVSSLFVLVMELTSADCQFALCAGDGALFCIPVALGGC